MLLLLIDTSRPRARVVLARGTTVIAQRTWEIGRDLGTRLLQEIDAVLQEGGVVLDQIDRIAVHQGPGSFSALRMGVVTATMLAHASGVVLVAVYGHSVEDMLAKVLGATPVEIVVPVYKDR